MTHYFHGKRWLIHRVLFQWLSDMGLVAGHSPGIGFCTSGAAHTNIKMRTLKAEYEHKK